MSAERAAERAAEAQRESPVPPMTCRECHGPVRSLLVYVPRRGYLVRVQCESCGAERPVL